MGNLPQGYSTRHMNNLDFVLILGWVIMMQLNLLGSPNWTFQFLKESFWSDKEFSEEFQFHLDIFPQKPQSFLETSSNVCRDVSLSAHGILEEWQPGNRFLPIRSCLLPPGGLCRTQSHVWDRMEAPRRGWWSLWLASWLLWHPAFEFVGLRSDDFYIVPVHHMFFFVFFLHVFDMADFTFTCSGWGNGS